MAWWHRTGLREPEDLGCHMVGVPCAAWTSAGEVVGHRKTHHTETLCLMTLWRKQGTRLSLLTGHPDQRWVRLTQAVAEQVHFFLGSLSNLFFLWIKNTCKVLSPVHAKDPFLRGLLVPAFTTAPELPPLKLLTGTSAYPLSPKRETKTQTHQCPNPACVQQEWGRTFSCMIWAGCLEQALLHICWQMCTV